MEEVVSCRFFFYSAAALSCSVWSTVYQFPSFKRYLQVDTSGRDSALGIEAWIKGIADLHRWDDWVMDDRMRKFNDENKELANTLRRVFTERQRNNAKGKKRGISEVSSNLDSDDLPSSTAGRKKAYQDLETVSVPYGRAVL